MKNLAGNPDCDRHIRKELNTASIPILFGERSAGEVAATLTGKLGAFTFRRAWYYWTVRGPMPLHVAKLLYRNPDGRRDVRAAGHCGAPHPKSWSIRRLPSGGQIWPESQQAEWEAFAARRPGVDWGEFAHDVFSDDPSLGRRYVEGYHIDTQAGLRLFAKVVRRFGLHRIPEPTP